MSKTFSIACHDCKKHLWIAQSSAGEGHVYTTPHHARALYDFLNTHRKHNLMYDENCESAIAEYDEIDSDDYRYKFNATHDGRHGETS